MLLHLWETSSRHRLSRVLLLGLAEKIERILTGWVVWLIGLHAHTHSHCHVWLPHHGLELVSCHRLEPAWLRLLLLYSCCERVPVLLSESCLSHQITEWILSSLVLSLELISWLLLLRTLGSILVEAVEHR